jgi:membrane protease subunit HflC
MGNKLGFVLILVALAALAVSMAVFTVDEREYAVKFRFGEIIRTDYAPGLHFKIPFVNNVKKFEKRILTRNNPNEEFLTSEKKNLNVDFYVKWRITDVGQYYRATAGNEGIATSRLIEIVKDGIRAQFAKRTVQQVVTADRRELTDDLMKSAGQAAQELGIEVIDVRVKRLDLPDEVSESVFNRMRQERARTASQLRAEGAEEAERIRSDADRQRTVILAEAYRDAEKIRGEGDAKAAETYASAYEQDREFYNFHRSMQAYRETMGGDGDVLVLEPDSEFFRYLKEPFGTQQAPMSDN